jgi:aminopeptidase N
MMQLPANRILGPVLACALLALPLGLQAQSFSEFHSMSPDEKRAYMDSLSEQERQAKREEWRAQRDAMSDEELAAMHAERMARREQMRAQWNALSDEEKQARRKAMRAHREERRAMWESMSPEERAAIRERRGDRHHGRQDQE